MKGYRKIRRPEKDEYPSYSQPYFDLIRTDSNILEELKFNFDFLRELILLQPEEKLLYRYSKEKWTIKEILVHNIDDERIYTYRALCYARNDKTVLPGFEEKDYAKYAKANERSISDIFEEYSSVRVSTIQLFQNLPEEALGRRGGILDENGKISNERTVRALAYHIAGHELHHLKIIKERYLSDGK